MATQQPNSQFGQWANRNVGVQNEPQQPQFSPYQTPNNFVNTGQFPTGSDYSLPIIPQQPQQQPLPNINFGEAGTPYQARKYTPTQGNDIFNYYDQANIGRLQGIAGAQGWTAPGQSVYDLIMKQQSGSRDDLERQLASARSQSLADLSRSGLDSGEQERVGRDVRRSGLLSSQDLNRFYDEAVQKAKIQDELTKQQANKDLIGLQTGQANQIAGENRRIGVLNQDQEYDAQQNQIRTDTQKMVNDYLQQYGNTPEVRDLIKRELQAAGWKPNDINDFLGETPTVTDPDDPKNPNTDPTQTKPGYSDEDWQTDLQEFDKYINDIESSRWKSGDIISSITRDDFVNQLKTKMPQIVEAIRGYRGDDRNELADEINDIMGSYNKYTGYIFGDEGDNLVHALINKYWEA